MTALLAISLIGCAILAATSAWLGAGELRRRRARAKISPGARRILFPFDGRALSRPALDAALRIARAEGATLVPAYLAIVPLSVRLGAPMRKQASIAMPLLEAIEQRAAANDVPVDARIEGGRTSRHAFRQVIEHERFDRIVAPGGDDGFSADDIAWLLEHAPGEILVLRPLRGSREEPEAPDRPPDPQPVLVAHSLASRSSA